MQETKILYLRGMLFALITILLLELPDIAASQQDESSSPSELLRENRPKAIGIVRDRLREKRHRLDALRQMLVHERETFQELLRVADDPGEEEEIRREIFRTLPFNRELLNTQLKVLREVREGRANLVSDVIADLGARARLHHDSQALHETLETVGVLLTDQRQKVREAAFRLLVPMHDQKSTLLLVDGLRDTKKALISPVLAIELLHSAGAEALVDAIRPYLDHSDTAVRAMAALTASVDLQSRPKIVNLMKDRHQPAEVRTAALNGLSTYDTGFPQYALDLIKTNEENVEIRKAAIHRFVGLLNYRTIDQDIFDEFMQAINQLASGTGNQTGGLTEYALQTRSYVQKLAAIR